MGSQDYNLLWTGAGFILIFLLVVLGLFALLVRRWREAVRENLKANRSLLRRLQTGRQHIQAALRKYSPADPAPYGAQAAELGQRQAKLEQALSQAEKRHVLLQERLRRLSSNPWHALVTAPLSWRQLDQETLRSRRELDQLQTSPVQALEQVQKLERLSLEVAHQAKQVYRLEQQVKQMMERLQGFNLQGSAFETAMGQQVRLHSRLKEITRFFFEASETTILEKGDKTTTGEVFAILAETEPQLEQLLQQGKDWEQQRVIALESVQTLLGLLEQVETSLSQAQESLEVQEQQGRMGQIQEIAKNLEQTVSRLEIESAAMVSQEAGRLAEHLREIDVQVHQAQEQQPRLETNLESLASSLKQLSSLVGALGTSPVHPIQWTHSSASLAALNRQANSLGGVKKRRTPGQVIQELGQTALFIDQAQVLSQHSQKIQEQHSELLRLLDSPELNTLTAWLQGARQTAERASLYAAENWPRQDMAASLLDDLQLLEQESQRLLRTQRAAPIAEDGISRVLEEHRLVLDAVQRLHKRVENVKSRLLQIQADEKIAQNELEKLRAVLQQIAFVVRSNNSLSQVCGAEVDKLQEQISLQQEALSQRDKDTLERKTKTIQGLAVKMEQSANRWLAQLNQALSKEIEAVSGGLNALEGIAPLDDGVVEEARRRLSASQVYAGGLKVKPDLRLEEIPPELKRRSDFYQSCLAAAQGLQELSQPVIEAHQAALGARKQAQQALAETGEWLRQNKGWPPSSLTLQGESAELNALEERWRALQSTPTRALTLVGQLASLGGQYQALSGKVRQGVEQAAQERAQIEELESDLEELAQRWQVQLKAYEDEPAVSREIRTLLDEIDKGLTDIRRQAQRKGESFSQSLQALKALQRKVRFYQVALDEEHAIDAAGNVQRKR